MLFPYYLDLDNLSSVLALHVTLSMAAPSEAIVSALISMEQASATGNIGSNKDRTSSRDAMTHYYEALGERSDSGVAKSYRSLWIVRTADYYRLTPSQQGRRGKRYFLGLKFEQSVNVDPDLIGLVLKNWIDRGDLIP